MTSKQESNLKHSKSRPLQGSNIHPKSSSYQYLNPNNTSKPTQMINQNQDDILIVRKQNQILHIKNIQLSNQIQILEHTHIAELDRARNIQIQCQQIQIQIQEVNKVPEQEWGSQRTMIQQQLKNLDHNLLIWQNKIAEVQRSIIQQDKSIPYLYERKQQVQTDLRRVRMENEGMKVVLSNLEKQIQALRKDHEKVLSKKKKYGPEQQKFVDQIQKNVQQLNEKSKTGKKLSKNFGATLIIKSLINKRINTVGETLNIIKKNTNLFTFNRKKLFFAINFHKKYIRFIKSKALKKFKSLLSPCEQQVRMQKQLINIRNLKMKSQIFGKWRKQFIKLQFLLIRKLEILTSFQKIQKSLTSTIINNCFNKIKYLGNKIQLAVGYIYKNYIILKNKIISNAFQKFKYLNQNRQSNNSIQSHSKNQTQFMIKNMYFNGIAVLAKANKAYKKSILNKYFKILKKNKFNKRKRELHSVLDLIIQKNNHNNLLTKSFAAFRYGTTVMMDQTTKNTKQSIIKETSQLKYSLNKYVDGQSSELKVLGLTKMSIIMNKTLKKIFYTWRRWNFIRTKFLHVLQMLHEKRFNDMNLGFAKIQIKRFKKLKQSIAQKIKSCQFSYNYLTQQNTHIKSVLDKKTLQLQKTKFVKIIKNLIQYNKGIMDKYLKRFNKRSSKLWKIRNKMRDLQAILTKKIKMVFFFLTKKDFYTKNRQNQIQHEVNVSYNRFVQRLKFTAFQGFLYIRQRNRKIKKILKAAYQRNLQIECQKFLSLIKRKIEEQKYSQLLNKYNRDNAKVIQTNKEIQSLSQNIIILKQKLKNRNIHYKDRNIIALKIFFIKRIKIYFMKYINRWRNKLKRQKRVLGFAMDLQLKFRIKLQQASFNFLKKFDRLLQIEQLQAKHQKFLVQYQQASNQFNQLNNTVDKKILQMQSQNKNNKQTKAVYKQKLNRFDQVKLKLFQKKWKKTFLKYILQYWSHIKQNSRKTLDKMAKRLQKIALRIFFKPFTQIIVTQIVYHRIRTNLSIIYQKMYTANTGFAFSSWRSFTYKQNKIKNSQALKNITNKLEKGQDKLNKRIKSFEQLWEHPYIHTQLRQTFSKWNRYSQIKRRNKKLKAQLQIQLIRSYSLDFLRILKLVTKKPLELKHIHSKFIQMRNKKIKRLFMFSIQRDMKRKQMFQKLFLKKFVQNSLHIYMRDAFANIKLYQRYKQIYITDQQTFKIQNLIETFNKVYLRIMGQSLKTWRKNEYLMTKQWNLLRRLTRKALNNRVETLFRCWRLQTQARNVVYFHKTEGQVKKRQIQFKRTKKYIEDFKKQKGLLLENEQGNLVLSPRVLQKKDAQEKKQNQLRYKLISRLLLISNGETSALKSWNNIYTYYILRTKFKKFGWFCLNMMRKPDLFRSFRLWNDLLKQDKDKFENYSRQQMIRVLQKQKDKIEIQYSKKTANQQNMNRQMSRFEILQRQNQKRQKLCGFVLTRAVRSKLSSAISKWKQVLIEDESVQGNELQNNANNKLQNMQKQIQEIEREYEKMIRLNKQLKQTAIQGLEIAEAVKNLTIQRDELNKQLIQKALSCEALLQQNILLNNRYNLASKQAFELLSLTKK